jgi:hypothetical protein
MRLIQIDYNPLRRSESTRTRANQSTYFARDITLAKDRASLSRKYLDIQNESLGLSRRNLDLQRQEFITNTVFEGINLTKDIIATIYSTVNQRNLQKQKSIESDYEKELNKQVLLDVANGKTKVNVGEDGKLAWDGLSDEAKSIQEEYQERIKSDIWNLPLSGAEQQVSQSLNLIQSDVEITAMQATMKRAAVERDTLSSNLLQDAVNLSIGSYNSETGEVDYSAIEGQINSMDWLSPGEQRILFAQEMRKADLGINRNILSGTTKTKGYQKAIETLDDPTSMIGELTDEDKAQFKEYVAQVDKETFAKADADATETFNRLSVSQRDESGNITQEALPLGEAVEQALQTVTRE